MYFTSIVWSPGARFGIGTYVLIIGNPVCGLFCKEVSGRDEFAFAVEPIETVRFTLKSASEKIAAQPELLCWVVSRDRIFQDPLRRADHLRLASRGGVDPFLRFLLIDEIFLEFPGGVGRAEFLEPLFFGPFDQRGSDRLFAPLRTPG